MNNILFTLHPDTDQPSVLPSPFVGVCGPRTAADYDRLVQIASNILPGTGRFIMAGIKDIDGDLGSIRGSDQVRPFVHCDFNTHEPYEKMVFDRLERSKDFVRGLQLNVVPWMENDFVPLWESIRKQYPGVALMLQAHKDIMDRYTPFQIASRLQTQPVDYILFDASQSRGVPYDLSEMREYVDILYRWRLPVRVVVSGGLGPATAMHNIFQPLFADFPDISCDAFLKLYDVEADHLSWPAVEQYLKAWRQIVTFSATSQRRLAFAK